MLKRVWGKIVDGVIIVLQIIALVLRLLLLFLALVIKTASDLLFEVYMKLARYRVARYLREMRITQE